MSVSANPVMRATWRTSMRPSSGTTVVGGEAFIVLIAGVVGEQADDGDEHDAAESDHDQAQGHVLGGIARADAVDGGEESRSLLQMTQQGEECGEAEDDGDDAVPTYFHKDLDCPFSAVFGLVS